MIGINKDEWLEAADDLRLGREMRLKAEKIIQAIEKKNKSEHALLSLLPEDDTERIEIGGRISGRNEILMMIVEIFDVDNEYYK